MLHVLRGVKEGRTPQQKPEQPPLIAKAPRSPPRFEAGKHPPDQLQRPCTLVLDQC